MFEFFHQDDDQPISFSFSSVRLFAAVNGVFLFSNLTLIFTTVCSTLFIVHVLLVLASSDKYLNAQRSFTTLNFSSRLSDTTYIPLLFTKAPAIDRQGNLLFR